MKMTFVKHARPGERFAKDAFDSQVGLPIPVNTTSGKKPGRLLAANVSEGGKSVTLTIEVQVLQPDMPMNEGEASVAR